MMLRRVLYSGDCGEKLSKSNNQWFQLDGFFNEINEIINFENSVAHITKAVYLGKDPLSDKESEIAYHFNLDNRLVTAQSGEEWEFAQIENVRHDVAVLICHDSLTAK